jgi:hypothetical protein
MSEASKPPSVAMPTAAEDRAITAAAKADPDAQPLTPKQLKAMVPIPRAAGESLSTSARDRISRRNR